MKIKKHIFITGSPGLGKTTMIENSLNKYDNLCDIRLSFSN